MNNTFKLSIGFSKEQIDTIAQIVILSSAVSGYFPCKSSTKRPIGDAAIARYKHVSLYVLDEQYAYIKKRIKSFVKSSRPGRSSGIPLYNEKRNKVDKFIKLFNDNGRFSVTVMELVTL